jgi:hypothetical protein
MNDQAYRAELERVIEDLIRLVDNKSLDPIIEQSLKYAYSMGKTDGYVSGVQAIAGDQR